MYRNSMKIYNSTMSISIESEAIDQVFQLPNLETLSSLGPFFVFNFQIICLLTWVITHDRVYFKWGWMGRPTKVDHVWKVCNQILYILDGLTFQPNSSDTTFSQNLFFVLDSHTYLLRRFHYCKRNPITTSQLSYNIQLVLWSWFILSDA